jgi:hypothetical protein
VPVDDMTVRKEKDGRIVCDGCSLYPGASAWTCSDPQDLKDHIMRHGARRE